MNPRKNVAVFHRGVLRAAVAVAVFCGLWLKASGGEIVLPPLPFPENALEPYMSKRTIGFHYGAHHKGYVEKLNELIADTEYKDKPLEQIIIASYAKAKGDKKAEKIFNNASQVWNHTFFWNCMNNVSPSKPSPKLDDAFRKSFGSFENFKYDFKDACVSLFGSGWVWLVAGKDGGLKIISTPNAMSPLPLGLKPLLVCDVWEHAYYLDYKNRRADFVNAFLDFLVDWNQISKRYSDLQQ